MSTLKIRPATAADVDSMPDVFYSAFHTVSPFMRQTVPDTPLVRAWFTDVHEIALADPSAHLTLVVDTAVSPERIVALGQSRSPASAEQTVSKASALGTWSRVPLSSDHNHDMFNAMIDFANACRARVMGDTPHYLIELLETAHEYKGKGAGGMIVQWICDQADKDGVAVFVETNTAVVKFYERFGFEVKERLAMPGDTGYEEFCLVRPARS